MQLNKTTASPSTTEKSYVWRMHQPERKYQLFPKDKQPAAAQGKSLDPEQAFALAMGQNGEKSDKTSNSGGLRIRIKEHNLVRRRKISVPELGPMTTVQEVAMDSRKSEPACPALHPLIVHRLTTVPNHQLPFQGVRLSTSAPSAPRATRGSPRTLSTSCLGT